MPEMGRERGIIRLIPEIHCTCGHWEHLYEAEGAGQRIMGKVALNIGWTHDRKLGWQCRKCSKKKEEEADAGTRRV